MSALHRVQAYLEVAARKANPRSQMLKVVMPSLSDKLGERLALAVVNGDVASFEKLWAQAGKQAARRIKSVKVVAKEPKKKVPVKVIDKTGGVTTGKKLRKPKAIGVKKSIVKPVPPARRINRPDSDFM